MVTRVKICGITNLPDAQGAVAAGADALGFVFAPESPRRVTPPDAGKIARQLPGHVIRVGVFVEPPPELVVSAIRECDLTMLQFHGAEEPEFCRQFGVMTMKAFRIRNLDSLDPVEDYDADAILLDSFVAGKAGGTGQTFNWSLAFEARRFGRPIFLAGGLTPENVADAVRAARPFAVDVSSGVEEAPGKKDHGKMKAFISAVRAVGEV